MNKCAKIAFLLVCLLFTTFLVGEAEEASVEKSMKKTFEQAMLGKVDSVDAGQFCQQNKRVEGFELEDHEHHPVKNFFLKPIELYFSTGLEEGVQLSIREHALQCRTIRPFAGRAPPFWRS